MPHRKGVHGRGDSLETTVRHFFTRLCIPAELEQQGLIQGFEFTHELAWNVLKDYLEAKGISGLIGSCDATRSGFKNGLVEDGDTWMEMIKARNLTSHAYDPEIANRIAIDILSRFHPT
jgi:nucleotidyltransferase substrate binding protein (TIGR01987 family)